MNKPRAYFEGWYLKHQGQGRGLALIPAYHIDELGHPSASLQIITDDGALSADFDMEDFRPDPKEHTLRLGDCVFSRQGCELSLHTDTVSLSGRVDYGPTTPTRGDIMGPFRFVPFLQCRHQVFSLFHPVTGGITLNGQAYDFSDGRGYIEGDRGTSFPRRYLWTQCGWPGGCIMISVAHIPFVGASFTGCIAAVLHQGRQYRLATYQGVRLVHISANHIVLRQGALRLEATLLSSNAHPLKAPNAGSMSRVIRESLSCLVHYRFSQGETVLVDAVYPDASFESVWDNSQPAGKN